MVNKYVYNVTSSDVNMTSTFNTKTKTMKFDLKTKTKTLTSLVTLISNWIQL